MSKLFRYQHIIASSDDDKYKYIILQQDTVKQTTKLYPNHTNRNISILREIAFQNPSHNINANSKYHFVTRNYLIRIQTNWNSNTLRLEMWSNTRWMDVEPPRVSIEAKSECNRSKIRRNPVVSAGIRFGPESG